MVASDRAGVSFGVSRPTTERRIMSDPRDDYSEDLAAARLRHLVSRTGVAVMELAVLFSAFDAVTDFALLEGDGVPAEELAGIPDPDELLAKAQEMTTAEGVAILRGFLDMSAEGEARLWRLLNLSADGSA
jgi:hypothetical protein